MKAAGKMKWGGRNLAEASCFLEILVLGWKLHKSRGLGDCIARLVPHSSYCYLAFKRLHPLSHLGRSCTCRLVHGLHEAGDQMKLPSKPQRMWKASPLPGVTFGEVALTVVIWAVCGLGCSHLWARTHGEDSLLRLLLPWGPTGRT